MRNIIFRAKREDNGEWVYGDLYQEKKPYTKTNEIKEVMIVEYRPDLCLVSFAPDNNHWWRDVIPETIGQFTGLKDKNGVEIYEDDIVLKKIISGYDLDQKIVATMKSDFKTEYPWSDGNSSGIVQCEYEVIGNIHDNPELLTKIGRE